MAWNVVNYMRRLRSFNVEKETDRIIKRSNRQIIEINQINLDKGLDYENDLVGTYSAFTQLRASTSKIRPNQSKNAGEPYNFDWTGDFINGIYITYKNNEIKFFSRGLGGAEKRRFILNNKLLGVSEEGSKIINFDIIMPQLQTSFKNKMNK